MFNPDYLWKNNDYSISRDVCYTVQTAVLFSVEMLSNRNFKYFWGFEKTIVLWTEYFKNKIEINWKNKGI